jgi:hypothetical protein
MAIELSAKLIKDLPIPAKGNVITYDSRVRGLGVRLTAGGVRTFILCYRTRGGRERRYTIGNASEWTLAAAREEALSLKAQIKLGGDPLGQLKSERDVRTVADLCDRFTDEYLTDAKEGLAKLRPSTRIAYKSAIKRVIKPRFGQLKVSEVTFSDIDALHRKMTVKDEAPYAANRLIALLSKMFNLSVRWQWRTDIKGIERNQEAKRKRYLSGEELAALTTALANHTDQQAANIVRLLILTGARRGANPGVSGGAVIPPAGWRIWSIFSELNRTRTVGWGLSPISFHEIESWAWIKREPLRAFEIDIILALDAAYLEAVSNRSNNESVAPHTNSRRMSPALFDTLF